MLHQQVFLNPSLVHVPWPIRLVLAVMFLGSFAAIIAGFLRPFKSLAYAGFVMLFVAVMATIILKHL